MRRFNQQYLGDGVYAFTDEPEGGQIWLEVQRENGPHLIALEPGVMNALVGYMRRVWPINPACPLCGQVKLEMRQTQ